MEELDSIVKVNKRFNPVKINLLAYHGYRLVSKDLASLPAVVIFWKDDQRLMNAAFFPADQFTDADINQFLSNLYGQPVTVTVDNSPAASPTPFVSSAAPTIIPTVVPSTTDSASATTYLQIRDGGEKTVESGIVISVKNAWVTDRYVRVGFIIKNTGSADKTIDLAQLESATKVDKNNVLIPFPPLHSEPLKISPIMPTEVDLLFPLPEANVPYYEWFYFPKNAVAVPLGDAAK